MADPEHHRNPFDLLVCDTDALIQIFCSGQVSLLRRLKTEYGIQCVIVEAVEDELLNPRQRHAHCITQAFQKALGNESLLIIDRRNMGRFTSNDPHSTYDAIQLRGQEYHQTVDRGEAYTHAAALVLRAAAMSNDGRAIAALDRLDKALPSPYLRAYDIFLLFHQRGDLPARVCDQIRKALTDIGDKPNAVFAGCKFSDGLEKFYPRLIDDTFIIVGSPTQRERGDERRVTVRCVPKPA